MRVLDVRNPEEALERGLALLAEHGVRRETRNGPALVVPGGVTTVTREPRERVIFSARRDANPFFHLAEALWMLGGRCDVELPAWYVGRMREYSDDGKTLHGAYGYRWRGHFSSDQLSEIVYQLKRNPESRRCVLQMWDAHYDLFSPPEGVRDLPCNVAATVQIDERGRLELAVFQRSGDAVWGVHGANAVHFSLLQEHLAAMVGVPVGELTQVTVNYHAYVDVLARHHCPAPYGDSVIRGTYIEGAPGRTVSWLPLHDGDSGWFEGALREYLREYAIEKWSERGYGHAFIDRVAVPMRCAYAAHRGGRDQEALRWLEEAPFGNDWRVAGEEWIQRRINKREAH